MDSRGHRAWAQEEFGRALLSDVRLVQRVVAMTSQLAARPSPTLPRVFPAPNDARAAYDLLNNPRVEVEDLLTGRAEACARRCDGRPLLVCPEDGSSWTFTDPAHAKGTGPIGSHKHGARGDKVMTVYALLPDGTPMGILAEQVWTRPEQASTEPLGLRALEDKESFWWTELQRRALAVVQSTCRKPPRLWFQMDREADSSSVLLHAHALRGEHYVTVRVEDNRTLAACLVPRQKTSKGENRAAKLHDALAAAESVGTTRVRIRSKGRVKRVAHVEIRVADVTLRLREAWSKKHLKDVPITVVIAREIREGSRGGDEPLEWMLYTTYPVRRADDALEVVRAYALRWRIERHHFATKTGACELPDSQLRSFAARRKWIVMTTSVSAHLQHVLYRARSEPDVAALEEFAAEEIEATQCLLAGRKMKAGFASIEQATLGQVVESMARLGGYQGPKRSGGPPGIQTFERGYQQVEAARVALEGLRATSASPQGARVKGGA